MSKVVKLRSNKYKIVQKYKTEIDCTNYKIINSDIDTIAFYRHGNSSCFPLSNSAYMQYGRFV